MVLEAKVGIAQEKKGKEVSSSKLPKTFSPISFFEF